MSPPLANRLTSDPVSDFRAKATLGVALASLILLAPFGIVNLLNGSLSLSIGTFSIVLILAANAVSVIRGHDHQNLTLYGLVPAAMVFNAQVFLTQGIIGGLWCFPAILACYGMLNTPRAYKANAMILMVAMPMAFYTLEVSLAARVCATLLAVSVFAIIVVHVINEQRNRLLEQIRLDPLTGLLNRTTLNQALDQVIASARGRQASLLAIDVDWFKRVNDTCGHACGDEVLCGIAAILQSETPVDSSVFRLGGEEFLVLLPRATLSESKSLAENLRRSVAQAPFLNGLQVTISIGLAPLAAGDDWTSWMCKGDEQLYVAKRRGRNRVEVSPTLVDVDRPDRPDRQEPLVQETPPVTC